MPWWAACVLSSFAVSIVEYHNRTGEGLFSTLGRTWAFIILTQFTLYYLYNGAPSMMLAWATFSLMNVIFRVTSSHYLVGEPVTVLVGAGVLCMMLGTFLIRKAAA